MFFLIFICGCNGNNENPNAPLDTIQEISNTSEPQSIKPLNTYRLLCFTNNNNQYSKAIIPVLDTLQSNYFGKFSIEIINIDSNPEFIDSFNIKFAPHIVILDSTGTIIFNRTGQDPYIKLIKALKKKKLID